jgi:hypothetical protein
MLKNLAWFFMVLKQEVKKRKWRAIFKFFTNDCYRNDIKRLAAMLHGRKYEIVLQKVKLSNIDFSHEINYPSWVLTLAMELRTGSRRFTKQHKPIKVIRSPGTSQYTVIDGNHRLMAMKLILDPEEYVEVRFLRPVV